MSKASNYVQLDGTPKVYVSSRQKNSTLYYTSNFDDVENNIRGAGPAMIFRNTNADKQLVVEGQFIDDVYIKDGYLLWENAAVGDSVSMEIVLPANTPMPKPERDGNYDLIDGEMVENLDNNGSYLMYPIDVTVKRFVNKVLIIGTNTTGYVMESSDTALLPNIFKTRLTVDSPTGNVNLNLVISMETYRTTTI